jgi:hypothetical protein
MADMLNARKGMTENAIQIFIGNPLLRIATRDGLLRLRSSVQRTYHFCRYNLGTLHPH